MNCTHSLILLIVLNNPTSGGAGHPVLNALFSL